MNNLTIHTLPTAAPIVFMPMDPKGYQWEPYVYTDEIKSWVETQIQYVKISPFFVSKENLVAEIVQEIERKGHIVKDLKKASKPPQTDIKRLEAFINALIVFLFG